VQINFREIGGARTAKATLQELIEADPVGCSGGTRKVGRESPKGGEPGVTRKYDKLVHRKGRILKNQGRGKGGLKPQKNRGRKRRLRIDAGIIPSKGGCMSFKYQGGRPYPVMTIRAR